MSSIALFKGKPPDKKPGELARVKVLKGLDLGTTFVVKKEKITIGRGEGVDVLIQDVKSSRVHATLEYSVNKIWVIRDLGSANGIILNGKMVRQGDLKNGDYFQIGDTLFEFFSTQASLKELISPIKPQLVKESFDKKIKEISKQKIKSQNKNPLYLIIGSAGIFVLYLILGEQKNIQYENQTKNIGRGLPQFGNTEAYLKPEKQKHHIVAERIFNQGFREYVEKNYLRATFLFDQALNTDPSHKKAQIYKKRSDDAILEEVKKRLELANLSKELGKKQDAIDHYEAVKRLLYFRKADHSYSLADKELQLLLEENK